MITGILGGIGALAAIAAFTKSKGKTDNDLSLFKQEVPMLEDVEALTHTERKELVQFAGDFNLSIENFRERISAIIPEGFEYNVAFDSDDKVSVNWRLTEAQSSPRIGRVSEDDIASIIKTLRAVDWEKESEIAIESAEQFAELVEHFDNVQSFFENGN